MKNRNKRPNIGAAQRMFRRTQWKFTLIIFTIATVLLAVSFVAIYLFTSMSQQVAMLSGLSETLKLLSADVVDEEALNDNKHKCAVIVIEGTVIPGEDGYYDEYEIEYSIVTTYSSWSITDEADRAGILEYLPKLENYSLGGGELKLETEPPLVQSYLYSITVKTVENIYKLKPPDEPEPPDPEEGEGTEPGEGEDPEDPDEYTVLISVSNKSYAIYDFTREQSILPALIWVLVIVFVVVIIAVFLLGFFFSGRVLKPNQEAYSRQKELVANASHELKTPITIINANLDVISSNSDTKISENTKWLDNIEGQTRRMNDMIIEMLELSSFESAQYEPEYRVLNLTREVEGIALSFEAACFERNITLDVSLSSNVIGMLDSKGISKLIFILLDNAAKYCNDNGNILVKLQQKKRMAIITVANTGSKIEEKDMEKLFDRFYKSGSASKSFGLGLSMAKTIAENMHGKITCDSDDEYTTFTVTLPL